MERLKFMRAPQLQNTVQRRVLNRHRLAPRLKEEPSGGIIVIRGFLKLVISKSPWVSIVNIEWLFSPILGNVHSWFHQHSMLHGAGIFTNIYPTIVPNVGIYFMEDMGSNNWEYYWSKSHCCVMIGLWVEFYYHHFWGSTNSSFFMLF